MEYLPMKLIALIGVLLAFTNASYITLMSNKK